MIGRVKGEIVFDTTARRTTLINAYQAWKVGKPILLERNRVLDEDGGDPDAVPPIPPTPIPPTIRFDVVFVTDATNAALRDWLISLPRTGVMRIFLCLHRCRIDGDPNPPSHASNAYFEWEP